MGRAVSVDRSESRVFMALNSMSELGKAKSGERATEARLVLPEDPNADEFLDYFEQLSERYRRDHRNDLMIQGLRAGMTLQAVGDLFGLTRERVRQIAGAAGITTSEIRRLKKEQADRRRRRVARHVYGVSLAHPELTIEELAEWADTDENTVREALEHRVAVHEVAFNDWSAGVTDDELLTALQQWAAETDKHTGDSYTQWAVERGLPGKQIPTMRFGGWNNALRRAGLHHLVRDRGGPRPTMSDEMLWAGVLQFFRDDLHNYSFQAYDEYWRDRGLASAGTVRARLGAWSDIKARVRQLMRYAVAPQEPWGWADAVLAVNPQEQPRNIVSKDACREALLDVAAGTTGPMTVMLYEETRGTGQPSAALIQDRFGSWVKALAEAGVESRMSAKARNKWTLSKTGGSDGAQVIASARWPRS